LETTMRKKKSRRRMRTGLLAQRVTRRSSGVKCSGCGGHYPGGEPLPIQIDGPHGRTVLGRRVPSAVTIYGTGCPHCGDWTTHSIGLPLDPDATVLETFERFIGGPASDEQKDALRSFIEAFVASPDVQAALPDESDAAFFLASDQLLTLFDILHEQIGGDWWRCLTNVEIERVE
jgi:hypothetical protein